MYFKIQCLKLTTEGKMKMRFSYFGSLNKLNYNED